MRYKILILLAALSAVGSAEAQPVNENTQTKTIQCIDVGGQLVPPACDTPASRLENRELICTCINGGVQVEVPVCAKGQTPPPEGKALNIVRRSASRDGTFFGDTFEGRQICTTPRGSSAY